MHFRQYISDNTRFGFSNENSLHCGHVDVERKLCSPPAWLWFYLSTSLGKILLWYVGYKYCWVLDVNLEFVLQVYNDKRVFLNTCSTNLSTILSVLSVEIPVLVFRAAEILGIRYIVYYWQSIPSEGMKSETFKMGAT